MKNILIALLCIAPIFYSCTKTDDAHTQAELNAAKLKTMIQNVTISTVIIWNGQQQTDTGGPIQIDDNGFMTIQSVVYSLEDVKSFALFGNTLSIYY